MALVYGREGFALLEAVHAPDSPAWLRELQAVQSGDPAVAGAFAWPGVREPGDYMELQSRQLLEDNILVATVSEPVGTGRELHSPGRSTG
ncbi:hypothetical protein ACFCX3_06635 [Streptomyces virginiae]|uniref:hypothetical protein n=1 Tax=Streptomyces virginiae TaxID=1961 RepID=UPI0035DD095E